MILHLVPKAEWDAAPTDKPYLPAAYAKDGFIHCTDDARVLLKTANRFYKAVQGDVLVITIDDSLLTSVVKWEAPAHPVAVKEKEGQEDKGKGGQGEGVKGSAMPPEVVAEVGSKARAQVAAEDMAMMQFPHIYGALNRDAIVSIRQFIRAEDGIYTGYAQENLLPAVAPVAPAPAPVAKQDPLNPMNTKSPSQMADELLDATDGFSEAMKRMKDRVEGRMERLDDEIKKRL